MTRRKRNSVSSLLASGLAVLTLVVLTLFQSGHTYAQTSKAQKPNFYLKNAVVHSKFSSSTDMTYGGGPVMVGAVKVYTIFWQPAGRTFSKNYKSLLQRFFNDFGQTSVFNIIHQYKDNQGNNPQSVSLGGTWTDTRAYPSRGFVTDADLRNEAVRAAQTKGWSANLSSIFFVYTTADEIVCFDSSQSGCSDTSFCAYHDGFNRSGTTYLYGSIPDERGCGITGSPNNDISADGSIDSSSHELMEAMSDALPSSGWSNPQVGEIGDPCAHTYGPTDSNGGDVSANGHSYLIQPEYSNAVSDCSMS